MEAKLMLVQNAILGDLQVFKQLLYLPRIGNVKESCQTSFLSALTPPLPSSRPTPFPFAQPQSNTPFSYSTRPVGSYSEPRDCCSPLRPIEEFSSTHQVENTSSLISVII